MKNYLLTFALFSSLLFSSSLFFSCKSSKAEKNNFELKYAKSPCKGQCPNFDVTIKEDQMAVFNGRQYTTIIGIVQIKLSDEKYKELQKLVTESNFLDSEVIEYEKMFDYPITTLELTKGEKTKKQKMYVTKPESLEPLFRFLDLLVLEMQTDKKSAN